jgi:hypothetical protein
MDRTKMPDEYLLGDKAWATIERLLPKVYAGARRQDDRRITRAACDPNAWCQPARVGVVEVEVPCKLVRVRLAGIPAISPFLLGRQKRDRHPLSREA